MQNHLIPANWPSRLYPLIFAWAILFAGLASYLHGFAAAVAVVGAAGCLGVGLRITELLVSVFTKQREANGSALALLFLAKFAWWALLFWVSRHISPKILPDIALGFAAFLLAMLSLGFWLFGRPKILPAREAGES